jgi:hypothetical protein
MVGSSSDSVRLMLNMSETLDTLAERIRESWSDSRAATSHADRIDARLRCGAFLLAAKMELGHGKYGAWQRSKLADLPQPTLSRYMEMFRVADERGLDLTKEKNLRQAYIKTDVLIPDRPKRVRMANRSSLKPLSRA